MISRQYVLCERLGLLLLMMSRILVIVELHHEIDEGMFVLLMFQVYNTHNYNNE